MDRLRRHFRGVRVPEDRQFARLQWVQRFRTGGTGTGDGGDSGTIVPDPNPVRLLTADAIDGLQVFGALATFRASDMASGSEAWATDLTKAGTLRLVEEPVAELLRQ